MTLEVIINPKSVVAILYVYTVITILIYYVGYTNKPLTTKIILKYTIVGLTYPLHLHIPPSKLKAIGSEKIPLLYRVFYYIKYSIVVTSVLSILSVIILWILCGMVEVKDIPMTMMILYHTLILLSLFLLGSKKVTYE